MRIFQQKSLQWSKDGETCTASFFLSLSCSSFLVPHYFLSLSSHYPWKMIAKIWILSFVIKVIDQKGREREGEEMIVNDQWPSMISDRTWNAFYSSLRTFSSLPLSHPLTRNTQFDLFPLFIHFLFAIFDREKENENERERERKYQREQKQKEVSEVRIHL